MKNLMRANERQTRSASHPFQTREDQDGGRRIEGYFVVFGDTYEIWPGYVETIDPHALDGETAGDIRCLIDHDTRLVLGRTSADTLTLRVDETGLWGSVAINPMDTDATNLYARVQRGDVNQCSFGFDILDEEEDVLADGTVRCTIKKVKLYEVSCVTFPAYQSTNIEARKADYQAARKRQLDAWKAQQLAKLRKTEQKG